MSVALGISSLPRSLPRRSVLPVCRQVGTSSMPARELIKGIATHGSGRIEIGGLHLSISPQTIRWYGFQESSTATYTPAVNPAAAGFAADGTRSRCAVLVGVYPSPPQSSNTWRQGAAASSCRTTTAITHCHAGSSTMRMLCWN